MFEVAELGRKVSRQEFDAAEPALRSELLEAQFALKSRKFPVIIIISGADCAGKGEAVHRLNEWLTRAGWTRTPSGTARTRKSPGPDSGGSGAPCRQRTDRDLFRFVVYDPMVDRVHREDQRQRIGRRSWIASPSLKRCWPTMARSSSSFGFI